MWSQSIHPGGVPYALAVDAVRSRLYLVYALPDGYPDRVAVYSLSSSGASFVADVHVGAGGESGGIGIAVNPTTGHVFVANSSANTMSIFDGASLAVLTTVATGQVPGMIGVNPTTNLVYIGNRSSNTVQVYYDSPMTGQTRR